MNAVKIKPHRKKKRSNGDGAAVEAGASSSLKRVKANAAEGAVKGAKSAVPKTDEAVAKRKRKRKNRHFINKNNTASSEESAGGAVKQTIEKKQAIVYPKENKQFSENWKKLKETMEINQKAKLESQGNKKRKTPDKAKKLPSSSPKIFKSHDLKPRRILPLSQEDIAKEIWFDDVDPDLIESTSGQHSKSAKKSVSEGNRKENLLKPGNFPGLTKALAIDCEMVGTGDNGQDSILARVSLVNLMGYCVYDKFVKPTETVTDFRTEVSGIRPVDLKKGEDFAKVQKEVSDLLNGRLLVGHAVYNDLKVLFLSHPKSKTRDTSTYRPFRQLFGGSTPSLKKLAEKILNVKVQQGEHSSVQDAQAAMRLYTMFKKKWENDIKNHRHVKAPVKKSNATPTSPSVMKISQLKI